MRCSRVSRRRQIPNHPMVKWGHAHGLFLHICRSRRRLRAGVCPSVRRSLYSTPSHPISVRRWMGCHDPAGWSVALLSDARRDVLRPWRRDQWFICPLGYYCGLLILCRFFLEPNVLETEMRRPPNIRANRGLVSHSQITAYTGSAIRGVALGMVSESGEDTVPSQDSL